MPLEGLLLLLSQREHSLQCTEEIRQKEVRLLVELAEVECLLLLVEKDVLQRTLILCLVPYCWLISQT